MTLVSRMVIGGGEPHLRKHAGGGHLNGTNSLISILRTHDLVFVSFRWFVRSPSYLFNSSTQNSRGPMARVNSDAPWKGTGTVSRRQKNVKRDPSAYVLHIETKLTCLFICPQYARRPSICLIVNLKSNSLSELQYFMISYGGRLLFNNSMTKVCQRALHLIVSISGRTFY